MIRVISHGNPKVIKKYIYKHRCSACDCLFSFEATDCTSVVAEKHLGGHRIATIKCPDCEKICTIDLSECRNVIVVSEEKTNNED